MTDLTEILFGVMGWVSPRNHAKLDGGSNPCHQGATFDGGAM